jgi:hypothetical protein
MPVSNQTTPLSDRGYCVANCQVGEFFAASSEEIVRADDERAHALLNQLFEDRIKITIRYSQV